MSDDNFDDGLVHSHGWARETMPEGITRLVAPALRVPANDTAEAMNAHPEDHDAGLVHNHGWAKRS